MIIYNNNKGIIMVLGELETRNFSFKVFANNEQEVHTLLKKAWKQHCFDYGVSFNTLPSIIDDLNITEFQIGDVFRDYDKLVG